ncbi:GD22684 [Drosophila simulans]|uniref:GD22684 n=1 Tax=Drosophila simulans TaxID=7240 RepID=B4Q338_DROSI|nr:GD22684 [Drosophila simulans]
MAPPSGSTSKMPRSCQQSHQLSVAQIAVTAKDMDADGEDAKDAEHADATAERLMRSRTFFPTNPSCRQANDAYLIGAKG